MAKSKLPSLKVRANAGDPFGKVDVLDANRERRGIGPHLVAAGIDRSKVLDVWKRYLSSFPEKSPARA